MHDSDEGLGNWSPVIISLSIAPSVVPEARPVVDYTYCMAGSTRNYIHFISFQLALGLQPLSGWFQEMLHQVSPKLSVGLAS